MKHFVVLNDWSFDYESGTTVLGVTHSVEKARQLFDKFTSREKKYAKDHGYFVYNDSEYDFDAGESGSYAQNHTRVYIEEVEVKE